MRSAVGCSGATQPKGIRAGRCEGHNCSLLSWGAPWPAMSHGCPVASTGLCTVINKCESCTLNLLQNVWTIPFSQKVTEAYFLVYEQLKLSAPCMGSQALQLNAFPVTADWTSPHDYCRLIQLHHTQPNQLSHQLSIFLQTANNSYFHLQCSPAKSNFLRIFKHQGHFVDSSWRKKQTLNSKCFFRSIFLHKKRDHFVYAVHI